jgi:hypothetical protein
VPWISVGVPSFGTARLLGVRASAGSGTRAQPDKRVARLGTPPIYLLLPRDFSDIAQ